MIPVHDGVVRAALGWSRNRFWLTMWEEFQDPALSVALRRLAAEADLHFRVSALRVLDVALWMGHRRDAVQLDLDELPVSHKLA
ncbi:hypothetical protein GTR02_00225 [Kineococcus sp. R8]|nr:DUF6308 family protein [Kineococcus siccus]NAZ80247.1 hypothetical protein [Kineococcus siccus]